MAFLPEIFGGKTKGEKETERLNDFDEEQARRQAAVEAEATRLGRSLTYEELGRIYGQPVANVEQARGEIALQTVPEQPALPTLPAVPQQRAVITPQQAVSQYGASVPAFESSLTGGMRRTPVAVTGGSRPVANFDGGGTGAFGATPGAPAAAQGPAEVDRARIDTLLGNVSRATSGIMSLGNRDLEFSAAQAQLRQGLEQGQRQALSLARSGSRRDRAGNEARAIQAGTELAGQTSQAAAGLRATEEAAQQQIRLDAYKAAGDLGLNAGALDLNAQQLDMNAATNFLNQLFGRENLNLQLDQKEAERVTNFIRDMALIERDYYTLSMQERASVRDDLTRRYGVNQQTMVALEQLEQSGKTNWAQIGASLGIAAAGATATILTGGAAAPVVAAAAPAAIAATNEATR